MLRPDRICRIALPFLWRDGEEGREADPWKTSAPNVTV